MEFMIEALKDLYCASIVNGRVIGPNYLHHLKTLYILSSYKRIILFATFNIYDYDVRTIKDGKPINYD